MTTQIRAGGPTAQLAKHNELQALYAAEYERRERAENRPEAAEIILADCETELAMARNHYKQLESEIAALKKERDELREWADAMPTRETIYASRNVKLWMLKRPKVRS